MRIPGFIVSFYSKDQTNKPIADLYHSYNVLSWIAAFFGLTALFSNDVYSAFLCGDEI